MEFRTLLFFALCLTFPACTLQQSRTERSTTKYHGAASYTNQEPGNWKAILIIAFGVLFFGAVIYGTNCFYVCKMHFFERTEKKYTKMDSTHV